jgi:serine/threonine-protein kinase
MSLSVGDHLGPYLILSSIGKGGMGEVYRARDTKLKRDVAIKVLPDAFARDSDRLIRFQREAEALAALNHPSIGGIYDLAEAGASRFLVLELIEGETLADRIARGAIPLQEALPIACQIAEAIEAAHERGIIHRDLKPANIKLTLAGRVKVLDFGLAKIHEKEGTASSLSESPTVTAVSKNGAVLGTAAYMSPEQAKGLSVDHRCDVFSFGTVLYELLSGQRPFRGETSFATLSAVVQDEPQPISAPALLEGIVRKCLAKSPSSRYQSMKEVKAALEKVGVKEAEASPSIAVLPFANMSRDPDDEFFSDGLAEEIINALAHVPGLKVTARTSAFAFRGKQQDIRGIAGALGVRTILEGSMRRAGTRIRVTAQLINAEDGYHLWSERYDRELSDVFLIQDEISLAIATALQVRLLGAARQYKPKLAAYEALLRGRHHRQRFLAAGHMRAKECFEQAIALDPDYAMPHLELGMTYFWLTAGGRRGMTELAAAMQAEARKALELNPADSNPHYLLGVVAAAYDHDWSSSAEHFALATSGPSVSAEARYAYSFFYLHPLGRLREAVEQMELAVEQDPLNVGWRALFGRLASSAGMVERGLTELNKALELDENHWVPNLNLACVCLDSGNFAAAVQAAEKAFRAYPEHWLPRGLFAGLLARLGETERAAALIRDGGELEPLFGKVMYHVLCSDIDAAASCYEELITQRAPTAIVEINYPTLRPLRESRHWPRLARMMNLPGTV